MIKTTQRKKLRFIVQTKNSKPKEDTANQQTRAPKNERKRQRGYDRLKNRGGLRANFKQRSGQTFFFLQEEVDKEIDASEN